MKKMILIIAALCCAAIIGDVMAQANTTAAPLTVLKQDKVENLSASNLTLYTAVDDFGLDAFVIGEAVKFTAPKPDWKLRAVQVLGWNGFNESAKSIPTQGNFLVEIRDKDMNLLYRMADTQNAYFTFPAPILRGIEIPATPVTGDFYVVFYDRGSMWVGMEQENGTGNSYFFNSLNKETSPAQFTVGKNNETLKVNWMIRAVGE